MPIDNLGYTHFTPEQKESIRNALHQLNTLIMETGKNELSGAERRKYGKVGEQGKLIIDKVKGFRDTQPEMSSPEVDWEEFENDYQDRVFAGGVLLQLKSLQTMMSSIKILRDHDNKTDALRDYQYAKYKSRFANQPGYAGKADILKQFFPKTGKTKKKD